MFRFPSAPLAPRVLRALSLLAFFTGATVTAAAAGGTGSTLDPVAVVGSREPQTLSRTAADIVVIDAATIRASTADSVEDLIRREAGMQLARNGGPGQSTGFFIRGAGTNSTVVMIDGVRIGSATLGQAELEALSLAQVERIEVLRGPASSLYGADAIGGVVQIFTRRGDGDTRFVAAAALGGYSSREGSIGVSGTSGTFDFAASLGRDSSGGVSALFPGDRFQSFNPDRDGYARNAASLQLGYTPTAGHRIAVHAIETRLKAHYDGADFPPPDFMADASPDFRNRLTTRVISADYRGAVSSVWTTTLQASRSVDDLTSGGVLTSRYVTRREQGTWQNALALAADQQLVIAYEHLTERASADVFASERKRRNDAFVAAYSGQFAAHGVQADVRRDDNSDYGGNSTGRLGYAFTMLDGLKLRALAGTTFRAPTFNDLYYPGYGVAGVRPEKGRSIEAGITWQGATANASATVFRNHVRDLIGYQPDRNFCPPGPAYDFGCAGNVARARLSGASLAGGQRWGGFSLRATADFLDAKDADSGERLVRRAAHQESVAADYDAGPWRLGAALLVVGSRPDGDAVLGGYGTLDLRASWRLHRQWRLEAKLLNALDHRIEPVRDYQGLGRQAWLGLRFDSAGL